MLKNTMRAFFAVDFDHEVKQTIVELINSLAAKQDFEGVRWIKEDNLHITTRFLGDITEEQCSDIIARAKETLTDFATFNVRFTNLIFFPKGKTPRVIALQPEPVTPFIELNQLLENCAVSCKLVPESRIFSPHLTIGKIKSKKIPKLDGEKIVHIKTEITGIKLICSTPSQSGSVYSTLAWIPFKKIVEMT